MAVQGYRAQKAEAEMLGSLDRQLRRMRLRPKTQRRAKITLVDLKAPVLYRLRGEKPLVIVPFDKAYKLLGENWATGATMNMTELKISTRLFRRVLEIDERISLFSRSDPVGIVMYAEDLARRLGVNI